MNTLQDNLSRVQQRIHRVAAEYGRNPDDIRLLAVSKTRPAKDILALAEAGQFAFGENYLQEALDKIEATGERDLEWHFIGPVQSNKTRHIAGHFAWLHSLDRLKIARRLSQQRHAWQAPLNVCVQVNISEEPAKAGVLPAQASDLCHAVQDLPGLKLRGLMAIPQASEDFDTQRRNFRALRQLQESIQMSGLALDTLSMGMSGDLEAAIAEGATLVRIGTDIFGPRQG